VRAVDALFDAYLLDMDGTVYLGDALLPGVAAFLGRVERSGRRRAFTTNNTTKTRAEYAAKLRGLGLTAEPGDIVTSGSLTAAWIRRHRPGARCFVLGEPPLLAEFAQAGIALTKDPAEVTLVVTSYDRTFAYWKLQTAFDALRGRPEVGFIATHPDAYCPFPGGQGEPDAAAVTAAVAACTGRRCEAVIGKPSAAMAVTACAGLGVAVGRTLLVGDRLATDIAAGRAAGTPTALVLTGDTSLEDLAAAPDDALPDYAVASLDDLA
jgi:phosphoglycolate/pyridoxal phosphate phosphatase family enzyme